MAGISDKAVKSNYAENKYRFQKQELQNKEFSDGSGLEMYEFKHRFDDDQVGRFWQVDPIADSFPHNSTYAFSEDKVTTHVELEGLEAGYINAKADGELAGIFQAAANALQNLFGGFSGYNKTSTSTQVTPTKSAGTTVTTTISTDFSNFMGNLINTNHSTSDQMFKVNTTVTLDGKIEIKTPVGNITNKTTENPSTGVVSNETGGKVKGVVDGVPISVSGSAGGSTDHQTTVKGQFTAGPEPGQATVEGQYKSKGSHQSVSVGVGGQSKAGNTTISTSFGISFSWF
jgi:hypothetical protein